MKLSKKGFTLIELLVVVLIIGILAAIAMPQYQMAVAKARVASMLPLMRRFKDALMEYNLVNDSYCADNNCPDGATLGVTWPEDWKKRNNDSACGNDMNCRNDYWFECRANTRHGDNTYHGEVECAHGFSGDDWFYIVMYQPTDVEGWAGHNINGMLTCEAYGEKSDRACRAIGGEYMFEDDGTTVYRLSH